jgi:metallo-beta-lactamase family protein
MASVTFLGACGTVTGSATLLEWTGAHGGTRVLVDCGLYQGGEELELRNWRELPFRAASLAAIVITHAHLDHTGLLPRLVAEGYRGPILCSPASRGLVALILEDSAALQEEAARYAAKKGYSRHPEPRPLYTANDARQTLRLIETVPFDTPHELVPGIGLRLRRAGHLLGAASLEITAKGSDGRQRTWCFSGDVGRYGAPILKDPEPPFEAPAVLVLESTYGDRLHAVDDPREALAAVVRRTFDRGGMVIIPSFALGRSQEVLYHLAALADRGVLDPGAVFLDSPMAIAATELYARAQSEHDEELASLVSGPGSPFAGESFHRCRRVEESKALNDRRAPAVIVAASGMAQGGRVVHHLKRRLGDPRATVLFIGYQAAGTRGRALLNGATVVAIHGQQVPVEAEILGLHSLSAHADRAELLRWCDALPGRPQRTFLNHGEDPARKALAAALAERGWPRPELPQSGQMVPW